MIDPATVDLELLKFNTIKIDKNIDIDKMPIIPDSINSKTSKNANSLFPAILILLSAVTLAVSGYIILNQINEKTRQATY